MYEALQEINRRPEVFSHYTAEELWNDEHISSEMLRYHLDPSVDLSSRNMEFVERSVDWIASRFGLAGAPQVADFGCGPGLYTTRFAARGARVTGIDLSERSIRYARGLAEDTGVSVDHVRVNYLEFSTDRRFDLITLIFCDLCPLSPAQRAKLLGKFSDLLVPGGQLLLDVSSLPAYDAREEGASYAFNFMDGFWSPDPYFGFHNVFKYDTEKVVLDKFTIVEAARTRVIYNWLQHFDRDMLRREIEAHGLVVEEFVGDVAGAPFDPESHTFAAIARKPS